MNANIIKQAVENLRSGELVVIPTDTVYGLAADATSDLAIASIFDLKNRPKFNPLILLVANVTQAKQYVFFDERAEKLTKTFCPGPLTVVLPRRKDSNVSLLVSAGLETLGVRMPNHPLALQVIEQVGFPLAAPSANISGTISPTTAENVIQGASLVIDGGPTAVGIESTVVDLGENPAVILRSGGITTEAISKVIGKVADHCKQGYTQSPGTLSGHYAPQTPLRLSATSVAFDEALLAFGPQVPSGAAQTLNLSPKSDLVEAAANLFAMLQELDKAKVRQIAVMEIPQEGLGVAINDRLKRAILSYKKPLLRVS